MISENHGCPKVIKFEGLLLFRKVEKVATLHFTRVN